MKKQQTPTLAPLTPAEVETMVAQLTTKGHHKLAYRFWFQDRKRRGLIPTKGQQ